MHQTAPTGSTFLPPISKGAAGENAKSSAAATIVDGAEVGLGCTQGSGMGMGTINSAGFQVGTECRVCAGCCMSGWLT